MKKILLLVALGFSCVHIDEHAIMAPIKLEPSLRAFDFEDGELAGWSQYPPAQDTAYDTTLFAEKGVTHNGSRFALHRKVHSHNATSNFEVGVIRRVRGSIASLSFALFIDADRPPDRARVILCSEKGEQIVYTIAKPVVGKWTTLNLFADAGELTTVFRRGDGIPAQAVVVVAVWEKVEQGKDFHLVVDDVRIRGLDRARFQIRVPATETLEAWDDAVVKFHPAPGKPFCIEGTADTVDDRLSLVSCFTDERRAFRLFDDGTNGDRIAGDGIWTSDRVTIGTPGLHRLTFSGTYPGRNRLESTARILVPPRAPAAGDHPRLYATTARLAELRRQSEGNGELSAIRQKAVAHARGIMKKYSPDDIRPVDDLPTDILIETPKAKEMFWKWYATLLAARSLIGEASFLYAVEGDEEAGNVGKAALLKICALRDRWLHPWFNAHGMQTYYMMGELCVELGIGYDLLYPLLSEEDRRTVREAVVEYGLKPAYHELVVQNRIPFHGSNWIAVNTSGQLIAALAILGDGRESADLEPYLTGLLMKMEAHIDAAFLADGSYGEGVGYESFSLQLHGRALPPMKNLLGVDFAAKEHYRRCYLYPIYVASGLDKILDFGDTGYYLSQLYRDGARWFSVANRDPLARWLYRAILENALKGDGDDALRFDYLLWDDGVAPRGPEGLPLAYHFDRKGTAVFRAGWKPEDALFVFQCGPFFNHNHIDAGTFHLRALGEDFITEAGKTHYYDNPDYLPYYIQPVGHNVLLVDGDPESMVIPDFASPVKALNRVPRIVDFRTGKGIDTVEAELAPVYKGKLKTFRRGFAMANASSLVMLDQVVSSGAEQTYTWLFHVPGEDVVKIADTSVLVTRPGGQMSVHFAPSVPVTTEIVKGPAPFEKGRKPWSILKLTTKERVRDVDLTVLFTWGKSDATLPSTATECKTDVVRVNIDGKCVYRFTRGSDGRLHFEEKP